MLAGCSRRARGVPACGLAPMLPARRSAHYSRASLARTRKHRRRGGLQACKTGAGLAVIAPHVPGAVQRETLSGAFALAPSALAGINSPRSWVSRYTECGNHGTSVARRRRRDVQLAPQRAWGVEVRLYVCTCVRMDVGTCVPLYLCTFVPLYLRCALYGQEFAISSIP